MKMTQLLLFLELLLLYVGVQVTNGRSGTDGEWCCEIELRPTIRTIRLTTTKIAYRNITKRIIEGYGPCPDEDDDGRDGSGDQGHPDRGSVDRGKGQPDRGDEDRGQGEPDRGDVDRGQGQPDRGDEDRGQGEPDRGDVDRGQGQPDRNDVDRGQGEPDRGYRGKPDTDYGLGRGQPDFEYGNRGYGGRKGLGRYHHPWGCKGCRWPWNRRYNGHWGMGMRHGMGWGNKRMGMGRGMGYGHRGMGMRYGMGHGPRKMWRSSEDYFDHDTAAQEWVERHFRGSTIDPMTVDLERLRPLYERHHWSHVRPYLRWEYMDNRRVKRQAARQPNTEYRWRNRRNDCPVYKIITESHPYTRIGYTTREDVQYPSCPDQYLKCCPGYVLIGNGCIEEARAESTNKTYQESLNDPLLKLLGGG